MPKTPTLCIGLLASLFVFSVVHAASASTLRIYSAHIPMVGFEEAPITVKRSSFLTYSSAPEIAVQIVLEPHIIHSLHPDNLAIPNNFNVNPASEMKFALSYAFYPKDKCFVELDVSNVTTLPSNMVPYVSVDKDTPIEISVAEAMVQAIDKNLAESYEHSCALRMKGMQTHPAFRNLEPNSPLLNSTLNPQPDSHA